MSDAVGVLCWLIDEPGAARVEDVLAGERPVLIYAVNLVEKRYYLLHHSEQALQLADERLQAVGVEIARDMEDGLPSTAVRLKVYHAPTALGDIFVGHVFAVALAARRRATLVLAATGPMRRDGGGAAEPEPV